MGYSRDQAMATLRELVDQGFGAEEAVAVVTQRGLDEEAQKCCETFLDNVRSGLGLYDALDMD